MNQICLPFYLNVQVHQILGIEDLMKKYCKLTFFKRMVSEAFRVRFPWNSRFLIDKISSFFVVLPKSLNLYSCYWTEDPLEAVEKMNTCWPGWMEVPKDDLLAPNMALRLRRDFEDSYRVDALAKEVHEWKQYDIDIKEVEKNRRIREEQMESLFNKKRRGEEGAEVGAEVVDLTTDDEPILHDSDYEDE
jgi:hypothetical protein